MSKQQNESLAMVAKIRHNKELKLLFYEPWVKEVIHDYNELFDMILRKSHKSAPRVLARALKRSPDMYIFFRKEMESFLRESSYGEHEYGFFLLLKKKDRQFVVLNNLNRLIEFDNVKIIKSVNKGQLVRSINGSMDIEIKPKLECFALCSDDTLRAFYSQ